MAFPFATADRFASLLDNPEMARLWLSGLGVRDAERAFRDLRDLAASGVPLRLVAELASQLDSALPRCPDPGMALTNLERFVAASPDREATLATLATNARAAEIAVQLFSTSQFFSELMIRDPALLDWLRAGAERRDRATLIDDLWRELEAAGDRRGPAAGAPPVPAPRDPPDRLQRHRPRPPARPDHARPVPPGRRLRRGRRPARPARGRGPPRQPRRPRRPAGPVRGAGPGQARRRGAELQLRHRPDLPLRRRGADRGPGASPTPSSSPGSAPRSSGSSPITPASAWPTGST